MRLLVALLALAAINTAYAIPAFNEVKQAYRPSETLILDRNGEILQRQRTDKTRRQGQWVALQDVSPALRTALVLSEDKRFYEHSGVDWKAVSAAAWSNLWNTKTRGASTITMQLAGLLDDDLKRASGGRSVVQKVGQSVSAQWLERSWRKDQVLEAYLNLVPFRGELVGIEALSQTLFGKAPHGLDQREAAVAAALVRAPNAKPVQVAQRACAVLQMLQTAKVDCEGLDLFAQAALQRRDYAASFGIAPHVAQRLVAAHSASATTAVAAAPTRRVGGMAPAGTAQKAGSTASIRSTLSAPLQRFAVGTLQTHLRELQGRHVEDGAIVVLDNTSGEVLAWVGSSGALSQAAEVDGVTALRQPGSTLKPFLYAQAIAERRMTAASLLDDSGAQIQTSGGLYIPQNYDHQFKGWVSARTALGASLNVPAVRTLVMVSPDAFHQQLQALGLGLKETGDYYGYSLALGSAEVSLLQLTNAYRALANGGRFSATRLTPGEKALGRAALDEGAAFIVGDILSDTNARARTFGTDSILATRFWTAVKTGTSKDMRDNWAVGYSQHYTVGVWVGNASGAPMWDVSGTTGAAPVWATLINHLHAARPSRAPMPPAGVVKQRVAFSQSNSLQSTDKWAAASKSSANTEAPRQEWFLRGTEQVDYILKSVPIARSGDHTVANARILSPTQGSILALDPDIPPSRQRLNLRTDNPHTRWLIDGKPVGQGTSAQWLPWPGRHVVQLVSTRGELLDAVHIEVRGAGVVDKATARR